MNDELITLGNQPVPRDPKLVRALGRRFLPAVGFIAYGVLYAFLATGIGVAVLVALVLALPHPEKGTDPAGQLALTFGAAIFAFVLAWLPFGFWVRRRRGEVYSLFREGRIVDATVLSVEPFQLRNMQMTRIALLFNDGARDRKCVLSIAHDPQRPIRPGERFPLMIHPACRYSAGFVDGKALPAL